MKLDTLHLKDATKSGVVGRCVAANILLNELAAAEMADGRSKSKPTQAEHAKQLLILAETAVRALRDATDRNPVIFQPLFAQSTGWPIRWPRHKGSQSKVLQYLSEAGLGNTAALALPPGKNPALKTPVNFVLLHYVSRLTEDKLWRKMNTIITAAENWRKPRGEAESPADAVPGLLGEFCSANAETWAAEIHRIAWAEAEQIEKGEATSETLQLTPEGFAELKAKLSELKEQARKATKSHRKPALNESGVQSEEPAPGNVSAQFKHLLKRAARKWAPVR
jgi:hypothetical protein